MQPRQTLARRCAGRDRSGARNGRSGRPIEAARDAVRRPRHGVYVEAIGGLYDVRGVQQRCARTRGIVAYARRHSVRRSTLRLGGAQKSGGRARGLRPPCALSARRVRVPQGRSGGRSPRMTATMSTTRRVARTSCARNTVAPSQAATAVAARVPSSRSSASSPSDSPTKSLRDNACRIGKPSAARSAVCRSTSQRVGRRLAEVQRRVDEDPLRGYAGLLGPRGHLGQRAQHVADDVERVRAVGHPDGVGARGQTAGVRADHACTDARRRRRTSSGSWPAQVSLTRSRPYAPGLARHLRAPRVEAQDEVGVRSSGRAPGTG